MEITCLPSNVELFCWMNLKCFMKEQPVEGETMLWRVIVNEVKLNVSPGSSFNCMEAGWYRVCFANMDDHTVEVALSRIRAFVRKEAKKPMKEIIKSRQNNLRVSFTSRRFDETIISPRIISPHSPIPQPPLVKAT